MSVGPQKPGELCIWILLSSSDEKSPEPPSRPFAARDTFVILPHIANSPGPDLCRYKHSNVYNSNEEELLLPPVDVAGRPPASSLIAGEMPASLKNEDSFR